VVEEVELVVEVVVVEIEGVEEVEIVVVELLVGGQAFAVA